MAATDIIWTLISLILTLLVFSYLLGDNPAFRLVISLFVGITAGYVAVILLYNVIFPKLLFPLFAGNAPAQPWSSGVLCWEPFSPRLAPPLACSH
jgi:hypothetical protein